MAYTFGAEIKRRLEEKKMKAAELARRAKTTRQNISRLINGTPHYVTGAPPTAEIETVENIAKALDWNLDEARLAAGYAPQTVATRPTTIPELVAALNALGIEAPQPFGGYPKDDDGEGYREVVERIWLDIEMVTKRLTKGRDRPMIHTLELSDFDIDEEINKRKSG